MNSGNTNGNSDPLWDFLLCEELRLKIQHKPIAHRTQFQAAMDSNTDIIRECIDYVKCLVVWKSFSK